jgi:nucleoid DNA-binding protein
MTKVLFIQFIFKKMGKSIPLDHIKSVINILLEEMSLDLQERKEITIGNFGKLFVKQIKPKGFFNIHTNQYEMTNEKQITRFVLIKGLREMLIKGLDIAKTFGDDYLDR